MMRISAGFTSPSAREKAVSSFPSSSWNCTAGAGPAPACAGGGTEKAVGPVSGRAPRGERVFENTESECLHPVGLVSVPSDHLCFRGNAACTEMLRRLPPRVPGFPLRHRRLLPLLPLLSSPRSTAATGASALSLCRCLGT